MGGEIITLNQRETLIESMDITQMQRTMEKIDIMQKTVRERLNQNSDYGIVPGTSKATLLKPGAEKILMLMGVSSEYEIMDKIQDYDKGFFAFTIRCILSNKGMKITEGVGHCNTKEKKYIAQDPYSLANTCLKMAKKRAQVDATLTVASLSDIFTQDMEDEDLTGTGIITGSSIAKTPSDITVNFGKHKGKTLGEILLEDKGYIKWLAEKGEKEYIKNAAMELLNSSKPVEKPTETLEKDIPPDEEKAKVDDFPVDDIPF